MRSTQYVELDTNESRKHLIAIGDVHYGAPNCERERFVEAVKWAISDNAWIVLMGDLLEYATKESPGSGVYQQIPPEEQLNAVVDILAPAAKKGLIAGALTGNHEEQGMKEAGYDPTARLCERLDIKYLQYGAWLKCRVKDVSYGIYATHGAANAKGLPGKMNALMNIAKNVGADIFLMGHVHELATHSDILRRPDYHNKCVKETKRYYVLTGSYLSYRGSYAEALQLAPAKIGSPRIRLDGTKYDPSISL